jgi:hypothetical protein
MCRISVLRIIFNLQRRDYVFFRCTRRQHIHDINCTCGFCECKKITLLVGMVALCTKLQTSALAGPMLRVNRPAFSTFAQLPLFPFPLPAHTCEH